MKDFVQHIPPDSFKFLLVLVFSFLIGLEQRRLYIKLDAENTFGTDRTFTLIGLLGFTLYVISPVGLWPFCIGFGALVVFLGIYYFMKIKLKAKYGITSIVTALLTYSLAPALYTQPVWLVLLLVTSIMVITEIKDSLLAFSQKIDNEEFITLAKFLLLSGVVLPLLPDTPISPEINISAFKFWLSVVVVSGISYLSYLLKKFVFPNAGMLLTGILGGLYSSTATTVILAKKSKEQPGDKGFVPAIIIASSMMYLRLFLLALFFNQSIAMGILPYFSAFLLISVGLSFLFWKKGSKAAAPTDKPLNVKEQRNPLEFKTALFFAGLFIFFAIVTNYVFKHYGSTGIIGMAFIVGVTDIDPFILNLFQHPGSIANTIVIVAVLNAISSNNLLKLIYGIVLGDRSLRVPLIISFGILIVAGVASGFMVSAFGQVP
jgi:uncharacterized membrane protein (DUF4010 family)